MKKVHIIILSLIGIVSFAAAFGTGFILKRNKAIAATAKAAAAASAQTATPSAKTETPEDPTKNLNETALPENQLTSLIYDLRQKVEEAKNKQKEIEQDALRVKITHQTLASEIEQLNQLRENLNQTLLTLQEKERSIRNNLTEIESAEKANLVKLAAYYDKMDPTQSAKILTTMTANNQIKDAVKILYYMSERTVSKLLGEIATTKPETASALSLLLKQIKEKP